MTYVYINSEPDLWTVGFYDPAGKWHPDSDHLTYQSAAAHTARLNGADISLSINTELLEALKGLVGLCQGYELADWLPEDKAIYDAAVTAIAKAEGR